MRFLYVVKWKPYNGRDGGLGDVKSFKTTAKNPANKLRKKGRIVSIRKVRRV